MNNDINPDIKPYYALANGIAKTFGSICEVVLHDLSHPKTSVIYVKNGHITGRKVGDGIRDLLLDVLSSKNFKEDGLFNYESTPIKGRKTIKSSTMVIRNAKDELIGAICLNIDISAIKDAGKFFEEFAYFNHYEASPKEKIEIDGNDVIQIIEQLIDQTVKESEIPTSHMKKEDFIRMIHFMDSKGVFLIKGAVEKVAEKLGISKYTVYGYLKEVAQLKKQPGSYNDKK